jgi:hypothetical protein
MPVKFTKFTLAFLVLVSVAQPVYAQNLICRGDVGNGYSQESAEYKTFGERAFIVSIDCSIWINYIAKSGACNYSFNGVKYDGILYNNGDFGLSHLEFASISGGTLSFKMSETTDGVGGNDGQRWFFGACQITD